jgi:hypothetical protein
MFGKNKPEAEKRQESSGSRKGSRRQVCSRVFGVFQTTSKHTAEHRVCWFAADFQMFRRQTDTQRVSGFRFAVQVFRVFQTTGKQTAGFRVFGGVSDLAADLF